MANRMDDLGKVGVWQVLSLRQPPVVAVASSKIAISHHRQPPSNLKIDQPKQGHGIQIRIEGSSHGETKQRPFFPLGGKPWMDIKS